MRYIRLSGSLRSRRSLPRARLFAWFPGGARRRDVTEHGGFFEENALPVIDALDAVGECPGTPRGEEHFHDVPLGGCWYVEIEMGTPPSAGAGAGADHRFRIVNSNAIANSSD